MEFNRSVEMHIYKITVVERYTGRITEVQVTDHNEDHAHFMARNKARLAGFSFPVVEKCEIVRTFVQHY